MITKIYIYFLYFYDRSCCNSVSANWVYTLKKNEKASLHYTSNTKGTFDNNVGPQQFVGNNIPTIADKLLSEWLNCAW